MKIVKGDLIKLAKRGEFDVICHGANCYHTMGAGIARQIASEFPTAFDADRKTAYGDRRKLGTVSVATVNINGRDLHIVNMYTQFHFGGQRYNRADVDYPSIKRCFEAVKHLYSGLRIGYPMVGCGLAGGDWNIVSKIIDTVFDGEDHTYVIYKK